MAQFPSCAEHDTAASAPSQRCNIVWHAHGGGQVLPVAFNLIKSTPSVSPRKPVLCLFSLYGADKSKWSCCLRRQSQRCWCYPQIDSEQSAQYGDALNLGANFILIVRSQFDLLSLRISFRLNLVLDLFLWTEKVSTRDRLARLIFSTINADV